MEPELETFQVLRIFTGACFITFYFITSCHYIITILSHFNLPRFIL